MDAESQIGARLAPSRARSSGITKAGRRVWTPITCTPVDVGERRVYRASGAANGGEIIKSLGQAQAFDLGGARARFALSANRPLEFRFEITA